MIDGRLIDTLDQADACYDMARRNDRAFLTILVNKIEELERRIDKLETELLMNHFEQLRKDEEND